VGPQANLLWERNTLGTPRPKRVVSAWAGCDWKTFTLAVDMRPGASPHIELCQIGNCNEYANKSMLAIVAIGRWVNQWHSTLLQ
jgi:hypothetical protein